MKNLPLHPPDGWQHRLPTPIGTKKPQKHPLVVLKLVYLNLITYFDRPEDRVPVVNRHIMSQAALKCANETDRMVLTALANNQPLELSLNRLKKELARVHQQLIDCQLARQ